MLIGTELKNKQVIEFCEQNSIKLFHPYTNEHAPHVSQYWEGKKDLSNYLNTSLQVERVAQTLQSLLYRHITSTQNYRYIDILPKLVATYNSRKYDYFAIF